MDAEHGPKRKKRGGRCEGCGLHLHLCMCARFVRVRTRAKIVVVQHIGERFKPTNTARLLHRMVEGTELIHYGMREPPFDPAPLSRPELDYRVVFPRDDAEPLDVAKIGADGRTPAFVFLDGTWHQCSRMSRRVPGVAGLPCVSLPEGPPSRWGVRTQHDPRGLSTFEAGVRLVSALEGPEVAAPMQKVFHEIAARLLFMKGKLPQPEVPVEWQSDAV